MDVIRLINMVFYGYHGTVETERELGQKFEVDLEISADLDEAIETDDLKTTVNYEKIYNIVEEIVVEREYNLLETLANHIATSVLQNFNNVAEVIVRVRKPKVPVQGIIDFVEIELIRSAPEF